MTEASISPHTVAPRLLLALYQPDIPQNTGTIVRMAACLNVSVAIIEPAGFPVSDRAFRRSGMDYIDQANIERFASWQHFWAFKQQSGRRILLATTRATRSFCDMTYRQDDIILFGRETLGVPEEVHACADATIRIPIRTDTRSLNLAVSAAMITSEALRQLDAFPREL